MSSSVSASLDCRPRGRSSSSVLSSGAPLTALDTRTRKLSGTKVYVSRTSWPAAVPVYVSTGAPAGVVVRWSVSGVRSSAIVSAPSARR